MTGTETDKFCLRWNEYESNLSSAIQEVREEKCLYDVTVSCDGGGQFPAHRLVLAACSQVMREILCTSSQPSAGPQPHQLVYLRGVNSQDLQFILSFMYRGEVSLAEDKLTSFLAVADNLQVKGLTQNKSPVESIKKTLRRDSPTKSLRLSEPSVIKPQSDDMREVSASNPVKVESVGLNQMLDNREVVEYEAGGDEDMYGEYRSQYEEHNFPFELGTDGGNRNKVYRTAASREAEAWYERREDGEFSCLQCGYTNRLKQPMQKHVQTHMDGPGHQCQFCFKIYKTENSLQSHTSTKHGLRKQNSISGL